ncbi:MAG: class I SAM-dependent methyltransferase [Gammaproteobacteria bacterium]|nr:class I SAM-dependent methyltransferase [Gammaproteobacteria bacterium]
MRQITYYEKADRLVYLEEKATPEFWDARWQAEGTPAPVSGKPEVVTVTEKYLPKGARVLEGGCGRADKVKSLTDAGYAAVGLDFAAETVKQARITYPDIEVCEGDVRALDFPDDHFDGYWSFGVIEHFWSGYDDILAEAARVLKKGGYLFLTAPWFSPYRRKKAGRDEYPRIDPASEPDAFYQFALTRQEVCESLAAQGFDLVSWQGRSSAVSLKDDVTEFRRQIDWLFASRGSIVKRALRRAVFSALDSYCGHSFLAVARRSDRPDQGSQPNP